MNHLKKYYLLSNAGNEYWHEILHEVQSSELTNSSYNAKTNQVVDAFETGLLDPTKVTRTALENASSVAGTILTTESVIFEKKDNKKDDSIDMGMAGIM